MSIDSGPQFMKISSHKPKKLRDLWKLVAYENELVVLQYYNPGNFCIQTLQVMKIITL